MASHISSVPRVKRALLATLQAHADLATLNARGAVTYGQPAKDMQFEHVWLGVPRFEDEQPLIRRTPQAHNELYVIPVAVYVLGEGNDPQTVEERLYEIVGAVEDAVRLDGTLGGNVAGLYSAVVVGKEPDYWIPAGARGFDCNVLVKITCRSE